MSRPLPLARRDLAEGRRGHLGWSLAIVGVVLLYLPFYTSAGGSEMMQTYLDAFSPELARIFGLDRMATGAGYTHATYFGLTGFLLLAIAAVGWGAQAVAGDEEAGSLELTLAHGVSRPQVVLERSLALLAKLATLCAVGWVAVMALDRPSGLELDGGNVAAVSLALLGLTTLVGAAALAVGAVTGRRSYATAAGAGVAVLAYVLDAVAVTADQPWLRQFSPYYWAYRSDPITTGLDPGGLGLLFGGAALLTLAAALALTQRDVTG